MTGAGPTSGGGIEVHRGLEHERAATISHLLIRLKQCPSARITIETEEDSTIIWPDAERGEVREDIQCKKVETAKGPKSLEIDDWRSGPLTKDAFARYLTEVRGDGSAIGRLKQPNRFFTLLAFAEPATIPRKYMPRGVARGGYAQSLGTESYFPSDFAHANDPDPNSNLGTAGERQKIRALFLGAPPQLRSLAYIRLNKLYRVRPAKALDAFNAIERLLYEHLDREPESRTFGLGNIEDVIGPYLAGSGKWVDVGVLRAAEEKASATALLAGSPLVKWPDFEAGRFIDTALIRDGARALSEDGFLVVAGGHGCGKTVLCKYLADRFVRENAGGRCFYLQAEPGDDLRDELDLFQARLFEPCLFIIDDEHFAEEQAAAIARAYLDARLTGSPSAKLIIASTEHPRSSARNAPGPSPLIDATLLRADFLSAGEMRTYLEKYREYRGLEKVDDGNLVRLAGGDRGQANMGTALVLLHAADEQMLRSASTLALENPRVRDAVGRWLAALLHLPPPEFEAGVAPVLTTCSFGLPVRVGFNATIERLAASGFLVADPSDPECPYRLRSEYASLAWIVSKQHLEDHQTFFVDYLRFHNAEAPRVAQALASDKIGRETLLFLLQNHLDRLVPADRTGSPDFVALASILTAATRARPKAASAFLRRCFDEARGGYAPATMHGSVLVALQQDVRPVTAFLNAAYRADRVFTRTLGAALVADEGDLYALYLAVCESPSKLEDLFQFLRAARNCDVRFGTKVCPQFVESDSFEAKWQELLASEKPAPFVRSLAALILVNRRVFRQLRNEHLTDELVEQWTAKVVDVAGFVEFLAGVRRLSPKISSRALKLLLDRHPGLVASLVRNAAGIGDASAVIASIARIDRRVAIGLARQCFADLSRHVAQATSYNMLGDGLNQLHRSTTAAISSDLATYTPVTAIVDDIHQETRRFELVGRNLSQMANIRIEIAEDIAERLHHLDIYSRIAGRALMDLTQLTRGFLLALPAESGDALLSSIRRSPSLSRFFHNSLFKETSLHQIADAVSALRSGGLFAKDIFRLFGTDEEGFQDFIARRVHGTHPDHEIANLLFALAQLNPAYAAEALARFVNAQGAQEREGEAPKPPADARAAQKAGPDLDARIKSRFKEPRGRRPYLDAAGTGALLHVASLIDEQKARLLLAARAPAFREVASDANLGRHTVLLIGTHSASRTECLRLLETAYTEAHLENLFDVSQNPRELIQFLYAVQTVSRATCAKIASFMFAESMDGLRDYLEAEVDLAELARWVQTLVSIGRVSDLDAGAIAAECAHYDMRLWALIDAAQAMIAAGAHESAAAFAPKILEQIKQARGVRKLSHCIQLWLKADNVARVLRQPRIMSELAGAILPHALRLVAAEDDHVSSAFAIRLWLDSPFAASAHDQLRDYRKLQILRAGLANPATIQHCLAAALLQSPKAWLDAIFAKAQMKDWGPWVFGLLQILVDAYAEEGSPPAGDALEIDLDQSNLKFGLACYAKWRANGTLTPEEQAGLAARNADESSAAIRALLTPSVDRTAMRTHPYYIWSYLRRTVLALDYLDWESEVHRANMAATFRKVTPIDVSPLLRAAAE
jgi:hypothetical protein